MGTSADALRSFRRPAASLAVLLTAPFLASADATIANVATPAIRDGLGGSGQAAQFVIGGYLIAYAVLLITGARLGQTHGYRRLFLLGVGVFGAASLAAGLAPDIRLLVGMRVVQGAGAALMFPQALTGIQLNFTGPQRARALSLFAVALSAGAVFGQVLGGILVSADLAGTGWRPIFLVNVPVCLAVAVCARRVLPADGPRRRAQVDLPGVAALSVSVLLIVVPLTFGPAAGWPGWTWASLAASLPAFALFLASQRRAAATGRSPLVHIAVLARPAVAWGLAAMMASTGTYFALLFTVAQYVQVGLGRSALTSGLILIPWVTAFGAAGQIIRRLPARPAAMLPAAGFLLLGAAYAAIGAAQLGGALSEGMLAALFVTGGLGLGTVFTTLLAHLTSAVPAGHAPDINGVFTTTAQIGGSIGVAGFGSLYLATASGGGGGRGFGVTALALAVTALLGTVPAWLATRAAAPVPATRAPDGRPRPGSGGQEVAAGWAHGPSRAASRS